MFAKSVLPVSICQVRWVTIGRKYSLQTPGTRDWGGGSKPDYGNLGLKRDFPHWRFKKQVPAGSAGNKREATSLIVEERPVIITFFSRLFI